MPDIQQISQLGIMVHKFYFFGNIKNRQPAYASLGPLEDPNLFFLLPKNQVQLAPQSLVLLENSRELISTGNFFQVFFFRKVQERTENTRKM